MTLVFNKKFTEKFRKQLRANQTRAEATLWHELRAHRLNGLKFRRQYSVNQYIIDFYCPQYQLAIELDGSIHCSEESMTADLFRQSEIEKYGITFLRF